MALSTDIYSILRANANIVTTYGTRIYPVVAPEKATLPCLVYTLTSLTANESKSYANKYDEAFISITAIATTLTAAETHANYVRTAMNRYTGAISNDKVMGANMTNQDWEMIPDFSYSGSATGVAVFAVNSQWRVQIAQNITE